MNAKMMSAARMVAVSLMITGLLSAQSTTRVNVDSQGAQANDDGQDDAYASISADGRYVAFVSLATNLVPADTNGVQDVFVRDQQTGLTARVSVDSQGVQANQACWRPCISGDGRFVAFVSSASNLVESDTNEASDVFVHDQETGLTTRASVDSQGAQANDSSTVAVLTADGRFVVFETMASNLVPGDTNSVPDVFVHDRQTGETIRASVNSEGEQADNFCVGPAVSADGRFVGFQSWASNLAGATLTSHAYVHDRQTGETTRVSVDSQGTSGDDWSSLLPNSLSGDGRFVAFLSRASNLVPGDTNATWDVFVHDRQTGHTERVSVDARGMEANDSSQNYALSASGQFVSFTSLATNLVPNDTNGTWDVFVHDRQTGATKRVSVDSFGAQANGESRHANCVSQDGRFIAFESAASNLVAGDTNNVRDVFVHEPGPCSVPASWTNYGYGLPGTNGIPGLVATADPVLCSTLGVFADNSSGADSTGILIVGLARFRFGTPWGGIVFVRPDLVRVLSVPASGLALTWPIPCDDTLCDLAAFTQLLQLDPGAPWGMSFTPALELEFGVASH